MGGIVHPPVEMGGGYFTHPNLFFFLSIFEILRERERERPSFVRFYKHKPHLHSVWRLINCYRHVYVCVC